MFLYSKTLFFHRNLDRNAFIDYYYTRMKNKIKLIPYLFAFNVLATLFTLAWMTVMLPYYFFKSASSCVSESFGAILNENKRMWNTSSYSEKKEPTEPNQTNNEVPEWFN